MDFTFDLLPHSTSISREQTVSYFHLYITCPAFNSTLGNSYFSHLLPTTWIPHSSALITHSTCLLSQKKKQIHDRHFPSLKLSQRSRRENIRLRLENLWCYRPPGSPGRSNDGVVHSMICTDGDQILVNSRAQIKSGSCRPNPPTGACLRNQLALLAAERFGDEGELE